MYLLEKGNVALLFTADNALSIVTNMRQQQQQNKTPHIQYIRYTTHSTQAR